jgi:UDP-N-acetylglucosamine 4,6-dehydratase
VSYKVVGIRPGEKLHEIMVTEDDSRNTLMTEDRYIIAPTMSFWDPSSHAKAGAKMVADGFHYASNNNDEWLSPEELVDYLKSH